MDSGALSRARERDNVRRCGVQCRPGIVASIVASALILCMCVCVEGGDGDAGGSRRAEREGEEEIQEGTLFARQ